MGKFAWIIVVILVGIVLYQNGVFGEVEDLDFNGGVQIGTSELDLCHNPEKYMGEEIILKKANIHYKLSMGRVIYVEEEDGNRCELRYDYYRQIKCGYPDITGFIDYKEFDSIDCPGYTEESCQDYYFNVTRAVCN